VVTLAISCNGLDDGSITINGNNGTLPLQFSIDNGAIYQATNSFTGLQPGTYDILIMDANGCTASAQTNISEPGAITASFTATDASCGNADGTLTINASGGTGSLQYSIDNGVSFQTSINFTSLTTGNYTIIIRDVNLCTSSIIATVNNAAAPAIQNTIVTDITCNGADNGIITLNASGGTGVLSYSIDNGVTSQPGSTFQNLPPGIYNIIVTDVNGCNATSQVSLIEPVLLTAVASHTTATCGNNNGSISISAQGGTGLLLYSINGGTSTQQSNNFNNLASGLYTIVVTDVNGCSFNLNNNVPNAPGPLLNTVISTDITCNGSNDGTISILANGGTLPLEYSIDNGVTNTLSFLFNSLATGNDST
jgi:hypothetical protein